MLRKLGCAGILLLFCIGTALADEPTESFKAIIIKVDGNNITFQKVNASDVHRNLPGRMKSGHEQTLPAAGNCKVVKGKLNRDTNTVQAGKPLEGNLKNAMFHKIGKKGIPCEIVVTKDNDKRPAGNPKDAAIVLKRGQNVVEIRVSSGSGRTWIDSWNAQ